MINKPVFYALEISTAYFFYINGGVDEVLCLIEISLHPLVFQKKYQSLVQK
ncbi:hypothetical protein PGH45_06355 [Legionella pneumophila]|nr:hypothetical protein [Legionella pneumophila]